MKTNWNFAVYLRLSKNDNNLEFNSISNQYKIIKNFLNNYPEISIYDYYIDNGYSGTNFNRPYFLKMFEDIKAKHINGIIVKDLSRLGRNYLNMGFFIENYFPKNNIRFISVNDNIDTLNDSKDNLVISFKNILNDIYSQDISSKVKSTIIYKKNTNKFLSGNTPYGYIINPNNKYQLIINKKVFQNIILIYNLYLNNYGISKIVKELNKKEIPSPKNKYWTNTTVHRILTNKIYCGLLDNVPTHEAIININTFNKVQKLLKEKNIKKSSPKKYLFSGYLRCYSCNAFMLINKNNNNIHDIYCSTHKRINENLCTKHYINSLFLEEQVIKEMNLFFKKLLIYKKDLLMIKKSFIKINANLKIDINIKKYIYNARRIKMYLYEKWKLKLIKEKVYKFYLKKINLYLLLLESLDNFFNYFYNNVREIILKIDFLDECLKYKKIKLNRELLSYFITTIYIKEDKEITIIFKHQQTIDEIHNFIFNMKRLI